MDFIVNRVLDQLKTIFLVDYQGEGKRFLEKRFRKRSDFFL